MQTKADAAATSAQAYGLAQCGTQMKFGLGNMFDGVKNVVKATYVSKAAGLCRDFLRKADAVAPPGNSLASAARYLDAILVLQEKLTADLKALPVPPGDEGPVNGVPRRPRHPERQDQGVHALRPRPTTAGWSSP